VPTSTVVMSRRDDLQMRILARRFCGAKPISQSASIEVFATLSLVVPVKPLRLNHRGHPFERTPHFWSHNVCASLGKRWSAFSHWGRD